MPGGTLCPVVFDRNTAACGDEPAPACHSDTMSASRSASMIGTVSVWPAFSVTGCGSVKVMPTSPSVAIISGPRDGAASKR